MKRKKLTELYDYWQSNKEQAINILKEKEACEDEFGKLMQAETKEQFEEIVYANFSWMYKEGIVTNWLPDVVYAKKCNFFNCGLESLPKLPKCEVLYCSYNRLTELNVPKCKVLNCSYNQLTELNVPKCKVLNCSYNQLTELHAPECKELDCDNNPIKDKN